MTWPLIVCAFFLGCKSGIDASALTTDPQEDKVSQMASTDDIQGPMERFMDAAGFKSEKKKKKVQLVNPPAAIAAYHKGEELMKAKKYEDAADVFWKEVYKKYSDYPIREDAAFMCGECYYTMKRYSWAQDKYDVVIKDVPATRHLDEISRRKFEIARIWLNFPEIVTSKDVQPVNFEQPSATPLPEAGYKEPDGWTYRIPILPNFTDKERPMFDTQGRALEALKSIWLNDPTGPLADDAIMLSASYYFRKGDYTEADHLYELLRKDFPKSAHLENAFVLGAHVKLMTYQGPAYDESELLDAKKLIEQTLKLYPNRPDRERMKEELALIERARAARIWQDVKYWKGKGKPKAVAIYCKEEIKRFPESDYAQLAREELAKLSPDDKADIPHRPYEDPAKSEKPGGDTPNVFNESDIPPKRVPQNNLSGLGGPGGT
jgi:outer membrane protein assembly factor BamD (BamD/ComL family)